ncbi:hypothetical protein [Amycolatopsis sp. 195334CR]|uniref:hypothetical protein n=1 Tax=Amycolatopsis sp. 195334CR TaxID=2814588 RepID=UPI001A8FD604|nr:hypothetical protein [Amycolatopsis sp. 195334CR]MBN6040070.1 hypothetical protein [Amycolatopsis sp. 195334CR]
MNNSTQHTPASLPRRRAATQSHTPRPTTANTAKTPELHTASGAMPAASPEAVCPASLLASPSLEQLPERISYDFGTSYRPRDGRPITVVLADGAAVGDPLTDAASREDYYRLHDVFHLSYATLLGWSPVTRALLGRKRRGAPDLDENEDGGRAVVIEEGIAAMVFAYAARRDYLRGHTRVESCLLERILEMTAPFEVCARTASEWESVILIGMRLWRQLRAYGGNGVIHADRVRRRMQFTPPLLSLRRATAPSLYTPALSAA